MTVTRKLAAYLRWTRATLKARPDTEHETTANRMIFAAIVLIFLAVRTQMGSAASAQMFDILLPIFTVYFVLSFGILLHIIYYPAENPTRRVYSICHDVAMTCIAAYVCGEDSGFFYPLFMWAILGNGFRFGVKYLFIAMAVSTVGFAALLTLVNFWSVHMALSISLVVGLVLLPTYVSRLIKKLNEAKRQAEQASKAKSMFLASISHELRTPLNAIISLGDIMGETKLDGEQKRMVRTIATAGRSLLQLINSILDLSRVESGQMPSKIETFDLFALVGRIRQVIGVQAQTKCLNLNVYIDETIPRQVVANQRYLEEILTNLAANAVKFTDNGHVGIVLETVSEADSEETKVRFSVRDTGLGIAPEAQARIFDSFTQADETIIDRFGGTGLGLALCKRFVEQMGGEIQVQSALGEGSLFWFEIPIAAAEDQHNEAVPESGPTGTQFLISKTPSAVPSPEGVMLAGSFQDLAEQMESLAEKQPGPILVFAEQVLIDQELPPVYDAIKRKAAGHNLSIVAVVAEASPVSNDLTKYCISTTTLPLTEASVAHYRSITHALFESGHVSGLSNYTPSGRTFSVLVAEDNRTNQMVTRKILERAGHEVSIVDDGELAVSALTEQSFDVVLMDVNMPNMNGIEATKLFRFASLGQEHVPIIALTADATEEANHRCLDAGMDACATKPIEPAVLLQLIDDLVKTEQKDGESVQIVGSSPTVVPASETDEISDTRELDDEKLSQLLNLGGAEFVRELIAQFTTDSAQILQQLSHSVADEDVTAFREQAHSLRSAAANIGATQIFSMCLEWRAVDHEDLTSTGEEMLLSLKQAFDAVSLALDTFEEQLQDSPDTANTAMQSGLSDRR
ncbi:MAG: ATP-binding protein [Stappiaceae bacterium]